MDIQIGVGYSEQADSFEAARYMVENAINEGEVQQPELALLFATARHDEEKLRQGAREVLGEDCRLYGGQSVGIITNENLSYDGFEAGCVVFGGEDFSMDSAHAVGLSTDEAQIGEQLGRELTKWQGGQPQNLLLLYDSVNRDQGYFQLNMATPLLEGLRKSFDLPEETAGFGMTGDMKGTPGKQILDNSVSPQSVIGLSFKEPLQMHTCIMHGCVPGGAYHTITKSEGATIYEIDNKPALEIIAELLDHDMEENWRDYSFFITLGMNRGEKYADFREENYVNRLCLKADRTNKALVMFEPDLKAGTEVQLMRRKLNFDYITERSADLMQQIKPRRPVFAFYIDCAGRASAYSGMEEEEAARIMMMAHEIDVPLLGVYTGVEIGPVQKRIEPLDWTGVLCVFSLPE